MLHYLVMLLRFSNGVLLLSAVLGPYLSGRAFDCRSRGHQFEPGWALFRFFMKQKISATLFSVQFFFCQFNDVLIVSFFFSFPMEKMPGSPCPP